MNKGHSNNGGNNNVGWLNGVFRPMPRGKHSETDRGDFGGAEGRADGRSANDIYTYYVLYIAVLSLVKREVLGVPRWRKGFLAPGDWCKLALWAEKTVSWAHAPATGNPLCFRVSRGPPCGQQPRMTRPGLPDQ